MRAIAAYLFRPMLSPAETMGLAVVCGAFDLTEWWIAIPLIVVWLMVCSALASRVRAA
jgi:hypothetical protein